MQVSARICLIALNVKFKKKTYPLQMFAPVKFAQPSTWSQYVSLQLHVD